jgi:RimJ/RimL family protein N-acetyltransferase/nitroimidazol reductase NimA-like FMN-containing flavoprotein (pyridoxamine 5'-phosphate oxidase superfamily)
MIDNGLPYVLPFNYGYDDNLIYIHCARTGKKLDLIRKNPTVCFEIEQKADIVKNKKACKWTTTYRSIVGYGKIEIVADFSQKQRGLEIIMAHNGAPDSIDLDPKEVDSVLILKLKIDSLSAKQSGNWDKIFNSSMYNLVSERLYLHEITWNDLDNLHQLHSIPEVDKFSTIGIPETIADTREVIKTAIEDKQNQIRKTIAWTIWTKDTNDFIGEAGINLSANRFKLGEVYYNLDPEYWNRGFGTEIAKTLIDFGFSDLGLHKVEAGVATDNFKSIRVLEKVGMTREGLRRKILPIRGEWKDNYHYAIVENDKRDY